MTATNVGKTNGRVALAVVSAVAIGATLFWIVDLAILGNGVPHPLDDTWEYGVAARALLGGHGFRTWVIHPPLWTLRDASLTVPILVHGPILPILVAPWVARPDASLDGMAWLAALFAMAAATLTTWAALGRAGPWIAGTAGALVTLSPSMMEAVHHDVSPALGACLVALMLALLARPKPRVFPAGLAMGAAILVRPELVAAAPIAAVLLGRRGPSFAAGVVLVAAPWWWRTARLTGNPLFNLSSYVAIGYNSTRPELSPMRDFGIPPARWPETLQAALPGLMAKWVHMFPRGVRHALTAPSLATGWLAWIGGWLALRAPATRRLGLAVAAAVMVPLLVCTFMVSDDRYFVPMLPVASIAAAWTVAVLMGRFRGEREPSAGVIARGPEARLALVAALTLVTPSTLMALVSAHHQAARLAPWLASERARLVWLSDPALASRPIFSDTPAWVAWTTGRPGVWVERDEYERLPAPTRRRGPPVDRPERGDALETWFHDDLRRVLTPGMILDSGGSARGRGGTR